MKRRPMQWMAEKEHKNTRSNTISRVHESMFPRRNPPILFNSWTTELGIAVGASAATLYKGHALINPLFCIMLRVLRGNRSPMSRKDEKKDRMTKWCESSKAAVQKR